MLFKVESSHPVTSLKMSRTLFGKPLRLVRSFVIDGLIVDSGPTNLKKHLHRYFLENPPKQALLTHCHEDHGGNIDMLNQLGLIPFVHEYSVDYLTFPPNIPWYRKFVWGEPSAGKSRRVPKVVDTEKHSFDVLPSPGHSKDHICLLERTQGWLFTGDLYVGEKIIYLYESENINEMINSLKYLSSLDFSTIFCSHRGIVEKGPATLKNKLNYIENIREEAKYLDQKGLDITTITKKLLGREDYMYLISKGEFSKTAFIKALVKGE